MSRTHQKEVAIALSMRLKGPEIDAINHM